MHFIYENPKWYDSFIYCQKELTYLEIFSTHCYVTFILIVEMLQLIIMIIYSSAH